MNFWRLIIRFIPAYKWRIIWYIIFNVFSSVFCIFSFATIIPLLQIIFGITEADITYIDVAEITSLSSAMEVLKNNTLYYLQEQIAQSGAAHGLLLVGIFLVITSALANLTSYLAYYIRIPIRTGIARDLRRDVYDKIVNIPLSIVNQENKGDFVSRMTSDVEEVDYGIGTALDMLIQDPIKILVYLTTLFGISWVLSIEALGLLLIISAIMIIIGITMKNIAMRGQIQRGKILSTFEETISHLPVIKSFCLETSLEDAFEKVNTDARGIFNKSNRIFSIAFPMTDFLIVAAIVIMLWIGGNNVVSGELLGASEFIYFLMIFYSIIPPMRDIIKATFGIRKAMASVERMNKILCSTTSKDNQSTIDLKKLIEATLIGEPIIEMKNIYYLYENSNNGIKNVSFTINKGQRVALVGAVGKGKTTIASLLMQFYSNYEGEIRIAGQNIKSIDTIQLRKNISYVPQRPMLFNDTIANNIIYGNKEKMNTEWDNQVLNDEQIKSMVENIPRDIDSIVGDNGCLLSGGQQQCVAIARALVKNAPIFIFDEATSALDNDAKQKLLKRLGQPEYSQSTFLFITHDADLLPYMDKVLNIDI